MSWTAEAPERRPDEPALVLDLDGYEGPIDLLLTLAREQKVDLAKLSILALADQYLAFISEQRRLRLEVAADYLVMAAWLAYLKSRLLLPEPPKDDEPSGDELAAALRHRLQLLEAMQHSGADVMARPQLGREIHLRGMPEGLPTINRPVYELSLYELLTAYAVQHRRQHTQVLTIAAPTFHSLDEALHHLAQFVGHVPEWRELVGFLPPELRGGVLRRSALASTFAAPLELARSGPVSGRRASGGEKTIGRRGRELGDPRLSPAGHPGGDRGDPWRRAGARHARQAPGSELGAAAGAARQSRSAADLGDDAHLPRAFRARGPDRAAGDRGIAAGRSPRSWPGCIERDGGRAGGGRAGARRGGRVSDQPAPAPLDAECEQA